MYQLLPNKTLSNNTSVPSNLILRTTDNAYIPIDENNIDYQAYQKWLSEGNTPTPASS